MGTACARGAGCGGGRRGRGGAARGDAPRPRAAQRPCKGRGRTLAAAARLQLGLPVCKGHCKGRGRTLAAAAAAAAAALTTTTTFAALVAAAAMMSGARAWTGSCAFRTDEAGTALGGAHPVRCTDAAYGAPPEGRPPYAADRPHAICGGGGGGGGVPAMISLDYSGRPEKTLGLGRQAGRLTCA